MSQLRGSMPKSLLNIRNEHPMKGSTMASVKCPSVNAN